MTGSLTAICDRELAGDAPDWVQLFPAGQMTARDGRRFNLADPQAVMRAFAADAVDLPVDYEHQADGQPEGRSGPVPAAGWIKELKADTAGLWGRVEWTDEARRLIASKAYRYLSPSFYHTKAGNIITRLKGAGLVHRPALHLQALARQENDMDNENGLLGRLLAFLNLPEDTTEEELFARLEELGKAVSETAGAAQRLQTDLRGLRNEALSRADPSKYVPIAAVLDLLGARHADTAARDEERARGKVKDALARGYITPGLRDWAMDLCSRDEAAFDSFMASCAPAWGHLTRPAIPAGPPPGGRSDALQSEAAAAVCAQLGLKPGSLAE